MTRSLCVGGAIAVSVCLLGALLAFAENEKEQPQPGEQERSVKESEVPAVALEALKKVASGASFTEFAEEIEHGHTFYEGSFKGPEGNVDALVTASGDLVELEESIPAAKVPAAVRAAAEKEAGRDAKPTFERKTLYLYELKYGKNGEGREVIFTADARVYVEGAPATSAAPKVKDHEEEDEEEEGRGKGKRKGRDKDDDDD